MDAGVGLVGVVLDVGVEGARGGDGEDVAVAGMFVEGVGVDGVGGLFGWEEEDGACVGVGAVGLGCLGLLVALFAGPRSWRGMAYGPRPWDVKPHGQFRLGS